MCLSRRARGRRRSTSIARIPKTIDGVKLGDYMGGSTLNAAMTMASCAAVAVPAGFDQFGRPVGVQIATPPRQEARALAAASFLERLTGLDRQVPD